jgi:triose/dihydroxyacetone kinase / FAD-AMP lyase (cyclizing)
LTPELNRISIGGISELELGGIVGNAVEVLREKKFIVRRVLAGAFMTSLNVSSGYLAIIPSNSS